jgi:hypothetical protein
VIRALSHFQAIANFMCWGPHCLWPKQYVIWYIYLYLFVRILINFIKKKKDGSTSACASLVMIAPNYAAFSCQIQRHTHMIKPSGSPSCTNIVLHIVLNDSLFLFHRRCLSFGPSISTHSHSQQYFFRVTLY